MTFARAPFFSVLLVMCTAAGGIISNIYSTALFLSTYPAVKLPQFLITQAVVSTIISFALTYLLIKRIKRNALLLLSFGIVISSICIGLVFLPGHWVPFIIAITIGTISLLLTVVGWNLIPLAFGLREYKKAVIYINLAATVGGVIGSLQVSILLNFFSLTSLLIVLIILLIISIIATYYLPITQLHKEKKNIQTAPLSYPLYVNALIFFIGLITAISFIDYSFKYELTQHLSKEEIGTFLGYFSGIANILGFVTAVTVSRRFLQFIRVDGLLLITPIFILLSALLVMLVPSLWTICILASARSVFFYTYGRLGMEIVLNILPSAARIASKAQLKSIVTPAATVAVFLFLLAVADYINIREISLLIIVSAIICILYVKKITLAYKTTLLQETAFRRFNLTEEMSPASTSQFTEIMVKALQATKENIIYFGLSTARKLALTKLPKELYHLLDHPNFSVRKAAINTISSGKDKAALDSLLKHFESENNVEIKSLILNAITLLDKQIALAIAKRYMNDPTNPLYPAALGVYLKFPDSPEHIFAIAELHKFTRHTNAAIKKEIAYIIGNENVKELASDLRELIQDPDESVSKAAIKAATRSHMISLAKPIIMQLCQNRNVYTARSALVKLGPLTMSILLDQLDKIHQSENASTAASRHAQALIIKVIGEISGPESEEVLLKLARGASISIKTWVAQEANYRACHQPVSQAFKMTAKQLALDETYYNDYLNTLLKNCSSPPIAAEIRSRIQLSRYRNLLWLAVATDPTQISKLIPSLLSETSSIANQYAKEKSLELLEIYITDPYLKKRIIRLFENEKNNYSISGLFSPHSDEWLDKILHLETHPEGIKNMDTLLKVFNLRAVDLFKDISGETLLAIAEETQEILVNEGDVIFAENDAADGLYSITSGKIKIIRHDKILATLGENAFFGELALLDDAPRAATAIAETDCSLLFLEKSTFDRITDDLPEVLRVVNKSILRYLRQHLS